MRETFREMRMNVINLGERLDRDKLECVDTEAVISTEREIQRYKKDIF